MLEPIKTTIPFCKKLIEDSEFIKGNYNNHLLNRFLEERIEE